MLLVLFQIITLNIAVLLLQKLSVLLYYIAPHSSPLPNLQTLGAKVSTKIITGQWWRLLTAAFLHVNLRHLIFNAYALYALGSATEIVYGGASFLSIYVTGAIGGNLASLLASATSARPSVGSSGAVFSLIASMCVHLERNRKPIGPAARENLKLVALATALNLAGGWLMPSVDGWAHFGGCVFGVLMGLRLVPRVILHRSPDTGVVTFVEVRRRGRLTAAVAALAGVGLACLIATGLAARVATPHVV